MNLSKQEKNNNELFLESRKEINNLFITIKEESLLSIKQQLKHIVSTYNPQNKLEKQIYYKQLINEYKEGKGRTIMHFACARGDLNIFKFLMNKEGNLSVEDSEKNLPLFIAAQHDNVELVKYIILEYKINPNSLLRNNEVSLLHIAASNGNIELCKFLIEEPFNMQITKQNHHSGSPLQWAVSLQQVKLIKYFLSRAKINLNLEINDFPPLLIMSINIHNMEIFNLLLEKEPKLAKDERDKNGWTPLHVAAELGYLDMIKILINNYQADVNIKVQNKTALDLAQENNKQDCVEYLILLTVNTNQKQNKDNNNKSQNQSSIDLLQSESLKLQGNQAFELQQYDKAIQLYNEAIKINSQNVALYTNRAASYIKLEQYQNALNDCQMAKQLNQNWTKTYFREGEAYLGLKQFADAAASFWEGFYKDPHNNAFKIGYEKAKQLYENQNK